VHLVGHRFCNESKLESAHGCVQSSAISAKKERAKKQSKSFLNEKKRKFFSFFFGRGRGTLVMCNEPWLPIWSLGTSISGRAWRSKTVSYFQIGITKNLPWWAIEANIVGGRLVAGWSIASMISISSWGAVISVVTVSSRGS
jgi:hypothetical protein